jgi:hypothetical protein
VGKVNLDHPRGYDWIIDQGLRRMPGFRLILSAKDQADVLAWLRHRAYSLSERGGSASRTWLVSQATVSVAARRNLETSDVPPHSLESRDTANAATRREGFFA